MNFAYTVWLVFLAMQYSAMAQSQKPNILIIMADDMGYDDISFHGSDLIPTPNIDALMSCGVALTRYYTAPMCTPSRSSLMTGKYPSNVGMQNFVIASDEPYGLGLDQKLLPEYMKEGGYITHLLGKWHLGFYKEDYTPTKRGFDTHFGYLGAYIDYFNQSLSQTGHPEFASGFDLRDQLRVAYELKGTEYVTRMLTDHAIEIIENHDQDTPMFMLITHLAPHAGNDNSPLQAPQETIDKFTHISDPQRRIFAAMVSELDTGIGRVVKSLETQNMLSNTIILFYADNGAPTLGLNSNLGSNYPLRGQKDSPWEGAARSASAIWANSLKKKQRVSTQLFHVSDWLPTFANIAGVDIEEDIDGNDIWEALSLGTNSPRNEVLLNLDKDVPYTSYIRDQWKYIDGTTSDGVYDGYLWVNFSRTERYPGLQDYGNAVLFSDVGQALAPYSNPQITSDDIENLRQKGEVSCGNNPLPSDGPTSCNPLEGPCLFNILNDPCERVNLALSEPDILGMMETRVTHFSDIALPPRNQPEDERSNPANYNNTWVPWFDVLGLPDHDYIIPDQKILSRLSRKLKCAPRKQQRRRRQY